jgi:hypothetical protein
MYEVLTVCDTQMQMYGYAKEWCLLSVFPHIAFTVTNGFKPKLKISSHGVFQFLRHRALTQTISVYEKWGTIEIYKITY